MAKPSVKTRCVANSYASADERIVEVSFPGGKGCLLSFRQAADGTPVIAVYRADAGIVVTSDAGEVVK